MAQILQRQLLDTVWNIMDTPVSQACRQTGIDACIDNGTCIFYDSASEIPIPCNAQHLVISDDAIRKPDPS